MIEVKPGMFANGQKITYPGEGHRLFAQHPGSLIIEFTQIPHSKFKRQGNDLIYNHRINLIDSLKSMPVHFTTIDNEMIEISVDEVISP